MAEERKAEWPPTIGLSVEEAAQALRVSEDAIRSAIRSGGLPARRVGKGYRIDVDALKAWLAGRQADPFKSLFDEFMANPQKGGDTLMSALAQVTGKPKDALRRELEQALHPEDGGK